MTWEKRDYIKKLDDACEVYRDYSKPCYICSNCGYVSEKAESKCPDCKEENDEI